MKATRLFKTGDKVIEPDKERVCSVYKYGKEPKNGTIKVWLYESTRGYDEEEFKRCVYSQSLNDWITV